MDVIIANLLKHLKRYQVDDRIDAINKQFNFGVAADSMSDSAATNQKPKELVAMLEAHIQIMLDIVEDIESKTFAIKQKEIGGDLRNDIGGMGASRGTLSHQSRSGIDTINENEPSIMGHNLNADNTTSSNKKKTRKSKYAK